MTPLLHRISQRLLPLTRRSPSPDTQWRGKRLRQRGFALGQAVATAAVLGGVGVVGTDWATQQRQTAVLEAQNTIYSRINDGIGLYMTLYYPNLIDRIKHPDKCATASYSTPASETEKCKFTATFTDAAGASKTREVSNILQPTLADLQALGMVPADIPSGPLLPVNPKVVTSAAGGGAAPAHENIYGIIIKRVPAGTDVNLESLVFNMQPYLLVNADMSALLRMSGGAGGSSGLPDRGSPDSSINPQFDLKGYAGAWSATNPVQQKVAGATRGLPGIMAWRNGFAAAASLEMVRRDGTLKPTADWDFADHSITNLNQIKAKDVSTVKLTTQTLTADGAVQLNSTLDVKGKLTALADMVVQGATDIRSLVVRGPATFEQPVTMQNSLQVAGEVNAISGVRTGQVNVENGPQLSGHGAMLKANGNFVSQGASCAQDRALAQDGNGRLVMCSAGTWQAAISDVYGLKEVKVGDKCSPDGAAAYLPDGLMAICRGGSWQAAALNTQVAKQPCSTKGMMAAETTANGVSNLLVCQAGSDGGLSWSSSIYARPKAELASEGANCNTDQINSLARNNKDADSGILMCTANDSGGAQWRVPFKKYTDESVDYNEYLAVDFSWKDWYNGSGNIFFYGPFCWGQVVRGPVFLKHWKNGKAINSWNTAPPTLSLCPEGGLYMTSKPSGGKYPDENYSFAKFVFDTPMNPAEWTTPIFRRPAYTCENCYLDDDGGTGKGPNRREVLFKPNELSFAFYNDGGSDNGGVHYYQLVMFKKIRRTYLMAE